MAFTYTYDTATPAGSDNPAEADDRMRETKAGIQERQNVDHYWPLDGTKVSDDDTGEHRKVTLRVGSAPTAVDDKGFVYAKDVSAKAELFYRDEDGNEVQLSSAGKILITSAALLGVLANNTYLTAKNAAGTGTVNLIKAGANDLATLPDGAEMASDAAPTEDEGIVNKKYVDDGSYGGAEQDANENAVSLAVLNTWYTIATLTDFVCGDKDLLINACATIKGATDAVFELRISIGGTTKIVVQPTNSYDGTGIASLTWLEKSCARTNTILLQARAITAASVGAIAGNSGYKTVLNVVKFPWSS